MKWQLRFNKVHKTDKIKMGEIMTKENPSIDEQIEFIELTRKTNPELYEKIMAQIPELVPENTSDDCKNT